MDMSMRSSLQKTWRNIQNKIPDTQFNYNFWSENTPRRCTYPACRAVISARFIDQNNEKNMISAIQQAYYLRALNPSNNITLIRLAGEIGINMSTFESLLHSETVETQLMNEIDHSRSMGAASFPSLVLRNHSEYWPVEVDYRDVNIILDNIRKLTP
jgi:putative protein-disulfide isomerase